MYIIFNETPQGTFENTLTLLVVYHYSNQLNTLKTAGDQND